MPYLETLCLDMPSDFPAAEYVQFMAEARRVLIPRDITSPAWKEFGGASNLIAWRYRASFDAWREHRESIELHGSGRSHEDVYAQERSIFMMFLAGVSCIESASYAMAAAASDPNVCALSFGSERRRDCNPKRLGEWLVNHAKAVQLAATLNRIASSDEWKLWVDLRNRMTHRSNLPRRLFASVGAPPPKVNPLNYAPTSSTPEIDAAFEDWDLLHRWLSDQLRGILVGGVGMLKAS